MLEIPGVVLDGRVDLDAVANAVHGDRVAQRPLLVLGPDELHQAALVGELLLLSCALVQQRQHEAGVEIGQFVQALRDDLDVVLQFDKNLGIGLEGHRRAGARGLAGLAQRRGALPALEALGVALAVPVDFDLEPFGERIHDRHTDAVQAAADLVPPAAELPAGVEHGHDDFDARLAHLRHDIDGDPPAIVGHGDAVLFVDDDVDLMAEPGERFVDAVVHHLEDQMVESPAAGASHVHAGTLSNALETFQDLNLLCVVVSVGHAATYPPMQAPKVLPRWCGLRARLAP